MPIEVIAERRIRLLGELQRMIEEAVKLSPDNSAALKQVIDNEVKAVRRIADRKPGESGPAADSRPTPEEIVELEKQLDEARKAGDGKRADELVNRILYGGEPVSREKALFKRCLDPPNDLFVAILDLVPSADRAAVVSVCRRWWALYPKWVIDHRAMRVLRALNDPALSLDKEVRKSLTRTCQKSLFSTGRIAEMDLEEQRQAADEFLDRIKPKISPAQWDKMIATLKVLDRWAAEDRAAIQRLKEAQASSGSSGAHP